jgi:hypothetical protein
MLGNQIEHMLVLGCGPQPGGERHPGWAGHWLYPTPFPQPHGRHAPIIPDSYDKFGSSIVGHNPVAVS